MLNIKLSVFIGSLIAAAFIGGISSSMIVHMVINKSQRVVCDSGKHMQQRSQIINTGRNKGY